jgi:hypothetical protein
MTDHDSTQKPSRLRAEGNSLERSVLESASIDQPSAAARSAALALVLANHRARERRNVIAGAALAALAAAAGVAFVLRPGLQPVTLSAEPHASAPPRGQAPPPSPSGASLFVPCTPLAIAEGTSPLIDDFEDGDMHVPMVEHRAGQWLTFNDGTGSQFPKPGSAMSASRIPGGRGASHFGIHNVGSKFSKWGANLSFELNPHRCYDASAYGGIEFWARGHGEIRAAVKMTQIVSEEFGGSCSHDCFDAHTKYIKLTREFTRVVVRWADLSQQGFGTPIPFDARSLYSIEFSLTPEQTPFDFWIDDVSFSPR